jgi:protein-S-isoprenylcysteine O-methyltransferase Ste14
MNDLNKKALGNVFWFIGAMALLVFVPAWTLDYWQAWIFLAVFSASVLAVTLYLMKRDPKLLARRVNVGSSAKKEKIQKIIQFFTSLVFFATVVFPPLDYRFGWSPVSATVSLTGDLLVAVGILLIFFVFKENSFASATVEIAPEQHIVSTGPYAIVRHPMYSGALIMYLGIPLALGSAWGAFAIVPMALGLAWRLLDEEKFLIKNLPGCSEYRTKVRYRLVPFIW